MRSKLFILLSSLSLALQGQHFQKVQNVPWNSENNDSRAVAWVDYNRDGLQDIFITNGPGFGQNNVLYRNDGNGEFTRITGIPLVQDADPSDGATWADYDNDENTDCFVANWYGRDNLLYRNDGNGNFSQISNGPVGNDGGHSETGSWGDYDSDGYVDLYVTNSDGDKNNFLYHNNRDGTFTAIGSGDPVDDTGFSRGVNWIDYDLDGDVDLFVTNELNEINELYRNDDSVFTSLSISGLTTAIGNTQSASWADYDLDGDFDVFLSNFNQDNRLYRNEGLDSFTLVLSDVVSTDGGRSFGSNWADINNDGFEDLFVANAYSTGSTLNNYLYLNNGDGSFSKIDTGVVSTDLGWTFGAAFGDHDGDGDMDLMCANNFNGTQTNSLYENLTSEEASPPHWVTFRLKGDASNRSAIGAIIRVYASISGQQRVQMRQISAQTGYCGQNMLPAHFGLGDASIIDSINILWPAGSSQTLSMLDVDSNYVVLEGFGTVVGLMKDKTSHSSGLYLYPNPSTGSISIDLPKADEEIIHVEVLDLRGNIVKGFILPNGKGHQSITLPSYLQGLFLVRVRCGDELWVERVQIN